MAVGTQTEKAAADQCLSPTPAAASILCAEHGRIPRFPTTPWSTLRGGHRYISDPFAPAPPSANLLVLRILHPSCLPCSSSPPAAATIAMSSLIDIWTLERQKMARTRGAEAFSWSVTSILGGGTARQPESCGSSSAATTTCDGVGAPPVPDGALAVMNADEKQAAAASGGGAPEFIQEDAFLSILVDCFGQ